MQPKTDSEIQAMREGGRMLATVLQLLAKTVSPGMSAQDLSAVAAKELSKLGGEPAFLGYQGFPGVICISVNEEVQHTIPGKRIIREGDVVNFDFGVKHKGLITDAGLSVGVGKISDDVKRLIEVTEEALMAGISKVKNKASVQDISEAVEKKLNKGRLGIVRELVGHGVGHQLHEPPEIPNYVGSGLNATLKTGMTICIEPITTLGSPAIYTAPDDWTFKTMDDSWSAQFEHTILVTESGYEILTRV